MTERLVAALLDEFTDDPAALARLRELVAVNTELITARPAYTVATLAAELGRTERSIRAAIARGELGAVKRGRGYVIGADAVAAWARGEARPMNGSVRSRPPPRRGSGPGPMRRALKHDPT